jgi:hypothetical protein
MLTKSKVAFALAIVLSTVSAAAAAPKHNVTRHHATIQRQVPKSALESFGSARQVQSQTFVRGTGLGQEPTYMYIQDDDFRRSNGGI